LEKIEIPPTGGLKECTLIQASSKPLNPPTNATMSRLFLTNLFSAAAQTFIKIVDSIPYPADTHIQIYPETIIIPKFQINIIPTPSEQYVAIKIN
jgi:hypothetical protein